MFAREADARAGAELAEHRVIVPQEDGFLPGQGRLRQPLAGAEVVRRLSREPRPAVAAAPDHHAISARSSESGGGVVLGENIAVNNDRDADRLLYTPHKRPIGGAGVELLTRATMDCDHTNACVLRNPS